MSVIDPIQPQATRDTKRTVALSIGAVITGFGALVAIAGAAILIAFGSDGSLSSGRHAVGTGGAAIITGAAGIADTADAADVLGKTSIQVDAKAVGTHGVFVGVGRTADVDRYLAGAATTKVTDFDVDPWRLTESSRPGTARVAPPADQAFWVAQSSGADAASIDWKIRDGSYRLVAMNADGSYRVATQTSVGITVENLPEIAIGILVVGLLIAGGGIVFVFAAFSRRRLGRER